MAPPRASSKAARMLGIPDFPPLSPQDATSPTQRRQSVTSIDDDDAQDHLSYASSEKTSAKSSFRMTVSTVASASTAASEYSFNVPEDSGVSPVGTLKMDQMLHGDRTRTLLPKRSLPSLLPSQYSRTMEAPPKVPSARDAGRSDDAALAHPSSPDATADEGSASRRRSHGDDANHPHSATTSWPTFETQPRARARPASPSPSTFPSATLPPNLGRPLRPSPKTVAALLSSRPAASVENLPLPDVASDSDPLSPLPLSAFPLPPTTIPIPPPLPAISAHRERPPSPLTAGLPARRPPRPQRAPRRPSTADVTVPGVSSFPSRSSTADSFYGASTSSATSSRHAPSEWTDPVRPATPNERRILHPPPTAPLPPPSAPLPSAPLPSRPAAPARRPPLAAPSGKAALLLGVGEPGRPATPEAHKKHQHRLLRKFMPRPHTADSDHHAPDFGSNHNHGAKADHNHGAKAGYYPTENAALAAKREAERIRHDAEVRRALHAFVSADPHPDWPPKVKKPKQTGSSAAMKGRSGWW
ncbi:uncharacterized protein SCHCODRAFT_02246556 [Schizophyllum commune H4-8]|uniref:uncharacterized protein n=1 Tax=Schizophyllum commune (strain H4-8 / FGSC 9210) TaxID=578458 RepID=UPI002160B2CD|nr:uncharacterized protein SCHCODRAFT_02246556 [Schizophyllum commune H4-8]KAI5893165.1 hypothetical protein SCHCODRAFT_02246556 [Schizophyllum commune H4-8]